MFGLPLIYSVLKNLMLVVSIKIAASKDNIKKKDVKFEKLARKVSA